MYTSKCLAEPLPAATAVLQTAWLAGCPGSCHLVADPYRINCNISSVALIAQVVLPYA